ncbi:MAG: hypothetical protein GY906_10360 [bacterium]|nr:hypothetical protein [bacterium]
MSKPTNAELTEQLAQARAELADKRNGINQAWHYILHDMPELERRKVQTFTAFNIDDVYASIHPLLIKHGVIIVPRVVSYEWRDGTFPNGGACLDFVLTVEYDFIAISDGTKFTAVGFAQGRDNQDKGPNKAIQQALKYVLIQMLQINTGEDAEEDPGDTPAAKEAAEAAQAKAQRESDILHYTNKAKAAIFSMAKNDKDEAKRGFELALHAAELTEIVTSDDADKVIDEASDIYEPVPKESEPITDGSDAPFEDGPHSG